ncbi:winged helix-turn-helix transcriptional regulator [Streptomyces arenae]|nr:winged helix-turn-helix transcriptional regulator [Streptomyces arenae]
MDSQLKRKLNAREIAARIRDEIAAGTFGPGDRIPGARAYAKKLGVALMTVQNAYAQLQEEGLVEGRTGSGTFVAETAGDASAQDRARGLRELQDQLSAVTSQLAELSERVTKLEEDRTDST